MDHTDEAVNVSRIHSPSIASNGLLRRLLRAAQQQLYIQADFSKPRYRNKATMAIVYQEEPEFDQLPLDTPQRHSWKPDQPVPVRLLGEWGGCHIEQALKRMGEYHYRNVKGIILGYTDARSLDPCPPPTLLSPAPYLSRFSHDYSPWPTAPFQPALAYAKAVNHRLA